MRVCFFPSEIALLPLDDVFPAEDTILSETVLLPVLTSATYDEHNFCFAKLLLSPLEELKVPFTGPNPFVIMNDRLLNNPIPPREINPEISPQLQEIIYRALERDPNEHYASAREFAWDLEHQDQVGVADRPELRDWKRCRSPWPKRIQFYVVLALIPVIIFIFVLLFYVARHT